MNAELEKRLITAAKSRNISDDLIGEIFEEYSGKICLAVNPIDAPSAPFVVAALKGYVSAIEQHFPGVEDASQELLHKIGSVSIRVPKKGDGKNEKD